MLCYSLVSMVNVYLILESSSFTGDNLGFVKQNSLVGLMVASATAEQEVLGSIPASDYALLGFSSGISQ